MIKALAASRPLLAALLGIEVAIGLSLLALAPSVLTWWSWARWQAS